MKTKRSQGTIFMIAIILILIVIMGYFYLQNTAAKKTLERSLIDPIEFNEDVKAFKTYFQAGFDDALLRGTLMWGYSGGKNTEDADVLKKTYTNEGSDRDIPYLYKGGKKYFTQEESKNDLENLIAGFFNSLIDKEIFTERDYELIIEDSPEVDVSLYEKDTGLRFNPHIRVEYDENTHTFREFNSKISIDLQTVLDETGNILSVLEGLGEDDVPYNFSQYHSLSSDVKVCGFDDRDGAYLVRIIYNAPFKAYPAYVFDFLTDILLVDNVCSR
ncbi:hypothetical protein CMO93_05720 [Candidatus Woesearchaeota archaeon]|nr:hypothetical protein [Candidatus Woesearchaeota archaeon]|tara:strand:+ start:235 stop:1053 length:819 start_codon:yes stop_codon:yes gene_type:complete